MLSPGSKIQECRTRKGWTQARLAAEAGIAQANLSNIEKGRRDLTVSTLIRLAQALGVRPSLLIEEEAPPKPAALTRTRIESIAQAVVHPDSKTASEIRKIAELFRVLLAEGNARTSSKRIEQAWARLRRLFSSDEIRGITARIEDARQRAHA